MSLLAASSIALASSTFRAFIVAAMELPSVASVPIIIAYFMAIILAEPSVVAGPVSVASAVMLVSSAAASAVFIALSSAAW